MRVKATITETKEVAVDPGEAYKALKVLLLTSKGYRADAYLEDGKIVVDDDYYTSHSWIETSTVKASPSQDDIELFQSLKVIAKNLDEIQNRSN